MVDIALLQSVSYIAGALGVCVAAIYYVMNLREVTLNRPIQFTNTFILQISSKEGMMHYTHLMLAKWTSIDDYMKKYDSKVDPESFLAHLSYFTTCEVLGFQYKRGLIDLETVYEMCGEPIIDTWLMYKPIIEEYKRLGEYGKDSFVNFEYLAVELAKIKRSRDPEYRRDKIEELLRF
jgi:hypothetical protein